ncbi:MAG: cyclic nucleotide-binding domain-containing protein [Gemmatimonadetes bacterium]|nr:cyclic nucleotide-binding domain-containing protein [Gemmatimonadota bacterium]
MPAPVGTAPSALGPLALGTPRRYRPAKILRRLSRIDILRALPPEEVQGLVSYVARVVCPAGTRLIEEGAQGDALYLIEEGRARVERAGSPTVWHVEAGSVVGEAALLTGDPRSATVTAETDLVLWRIGKQDFDELVKRSPNLRQALEQLVAQRRQGIVPPLPSRHFWVSTALRALEARYRGLTAWQLLMGLGLLGWIGLFLNHRFGLVEAENQAVLLAVLQLLVGLLLIQGSCEALVIGVERLGARLHWDGFVSGTMGSLLSNLPEFVVIAFLVLVEPFAAFVTTAVTIFNNALGFSVYSFFLPKDRRGVFAMPRSLTAAGGEIMIAGGAITLIVGIVMLVARVGQVRAALAGFDLIGIGIVLAATYGYYLITLARYYGEGKDDQESIPPDPERLGHDSSARGIGSMFGLGLLGAYTGGETIGGFADTALKGLALPLIPTAVVLAFFAAISEYIIAFKSHRRGELGIALSSVFGGLTQVMFLLLPFGIVVIGVAGLMSPDGKYAVPINAITLLLMLLLFPLFYTLHQYVEQDKAVSNLGAAGMTGIYLLLLYFLLTASA